MFYLYWVTCMLWSIYVSSMHIKQYKLGYFKAIIHYSIHYFLCPISIAYFAFNGIVKDYREDNMSL
jgi:hypothetical protein